VYVPAVRSDRSERIRADVAGYLIRLGRPDATDAEVEAAARAARADELATRDGAYTLLLAIQLDGARC
jgi:hypothetical protein